MKKILTILLLAAAMLSGCVKDAKPIIPGNYYNMVMGQSDKNWHPVNPVYVRRIYFNEAAGMNYCECLAHYYGWPVLAPGVVFNAAPDSVLIWHLPINDLR